MTRVVLASASPGRRKVLQSAGIDPLVVVSGVDEEALVSALSDDTGPGEVTTALATAKTAAVAHVLDPEVTADCVVVGCDSMLYLDGRLWGKPATEAAAIDGWQAMAGHSGELFTGHCVMRLRAHRIETTVAAHALTTVRFGHPSAADVLAYARSGEPTAVAGGFTLDGRGGWFVDGIDGDWSNVIGISLPLIRNMWEQAGLSISTLWEANPLTS